jgi:hypothetical protein
MDHKRNSSLVVHALRSVCETFATDPKEAAQLLRHALVSDHVRSYGHEELGWVARYVNKQLRLDPGFVRDLYIAAFSWKDKSDQQTRMGPGQIIALHSDRKQDYQQVRWQLAEKYPEFVTHAPSEAALAMIAAMEAYVQDERNDSIELWSSIFKESGIEDSGRKQTAPAEESFSVNGDQAIIRLDDSHHYDRSWSDEQALRLLGGFFHYLELAAPQGPDKRFFEVITTLIRANHLGLIWSRLLKLAAAHDFVALHLKELAWAKPLLLAPATEASMPVFLKTLYPLLGAPEKQSLTDFITGLPASMEENVRDAAKRRCDLLLNSIHATSEKTPEPETEELSSGPIALTTAESFVPGFTQLGLDDRRRKAGSMDRFHDVKAITREFATANSQQIPTLVEAKGVLRHLRELNGLLKERPPETEEEVQYGSAPAFLAAACGEIAGIKSLTPASALGKFVRSTLIALASADAPTPSVENDEEFDRSPGRSWPETRIQVAEGLVKLAAKPPFNDRSLLIALDRLANDPTAVVRAELARNCLFLHRQNPRSMWKWIENWSKDSSTYVGHLAVENLHRLASEYPNRAVPLVISALHTTSRERAGSNRVIKSCMLALLNLYVWKGNSLAGAELRAVVADLLNRHEEASEILFPLREPLIHGAIDAKSDEHDIRKRAVDLLISVVSKSTAPIKDMLEQEHAGKAPTEREREHFQILAKLANTIAGEVYFASGAFQPDRQHSAPLIQKPEQERFYREAGSIFDDLAVIALPGLAHHLVETLEMFIPIDPLGVFLRIAAVVRAGKRWGYEYEELAQDLIVRIVERYLAEHRPLLQQDRRCQTSLRETLETFITAASARAQALAYKVDEIFR